MFFRNSSNHSKTVATTPVTMTNASPPPIPMASTSDPHPVVFGTYNYSHSEILEDATNQAVYLLELYKQPPMIDTAMKYRNLETILKVLERHPEARIGWKVEHSPRVKISWSSRLSATKTNGSGSDKDAFGSEAVKGGSGSSSQVDIQTGSGDAENVPHQEETKTVNGKSMYDGIAFLKARVPNDKIFRILLHNYCGKKAYLEFQRLVEREFGADMPIGICNISAEQLGNLMLPGSLPNNKDRGPMAAHCEGQKARIDWVQNEYHPFLETCVPEICRKHGIRFEAHSVMTNITGYADMFKRIGVCSDLLSDTKSADLALKYATKQGGVCFTTANFSHLKQNLGTLLIPQTDEQDAALLSAMSQFSRWKRFVRYKGAKTEINADWIKACDPLQIRDEILPRLKRDIATYEAGRTPSNLCIQIPKGFRKDLKVHHLLAEMLYGEDVEAQMEELRKKLQQKMMRLEESESQDADGHNNTSDTINDEDLKTRLMARWSGKLDAVLKKMRFSVNKEQENQVNVKRAPKPVQAVQQPEALPMDSYPEATEFADVFQFIKTGGSVGVQDGDKELPVNIRFKHGTINSDGRLDLCKQGFRNAFSESCDAVIQDGGKFPVNIRFKHGTINSDGRLDLCKQGFRNAFYESCDAVVRDKQEKTSDSKNPLIRHYLIGNNRIGEDEDIPGEGNRRVAALANMIRHRPDIVTWYLAGNSMDNQQIQSVTDALEQTQAKYIWLKMNPVKTGAYHLGQLIMSNTHIELLDLFNCGLCNNGLAAFAQGLADGAAKNPSSPYSNLRHIYISINGIDSATDLLQALTFLPHLESLFIGVNPFGDTGLEEIADAFVHSIPCRKVLKRLIVGSMGLTDVSLPLIEKIVVACPNLVSLELDSYKSTNYFKQPHNRFDVSNIATCMQLVRIAQALVQNARHTPTPSMHYLGLQNTLVVGARSDTQATAAEAKVILDNFVKNQLNGDTGINVNGITNLFCSERRKTTENGEGESDRDKDEEKGAGTKPVGDSNFSNRVAAGGLVLTEGITMEDLSTGVRHPWPAVDYIKSIYRNTMKV